MTTQILKFYENTNVFITGGTGFLGKILIEKLLRSTSVSTVYILVRAKKGKDAEARIKDLFEDVIFERLHAECPKFIHRIVGVSGDVSLPELGLSQADRQTLIEKINIVFHGAATLRFDENLKVAYNVNVNGAREVLHLGKQMKNLKSYIHVSTAFSNCNLKEIEERFYDYSTNYEEIGSVLEKLTETQADTHTPRIIGSWPNTYTFTKALAESMIRESCDDLQIGVFRPSIVISTYKEPTEGWIDNLNGPTGICAGAYAGILRVLYCNKLRKADMVPVDMCVSALLASGWDVAQKDKCQRSSENIPIYNYVSSENSLTWTEYCTLNRFYCCKYPSSRSLWAPMLHLTDNIYLYTFLKIVLHLIPALLMDFVSMLFFRNLRMLSIYKKIHKLSNVLGYFSNREWTFSNDNVVKLWNRLDEADKKTFYFDMASMDWWAYYKKYILGVRRYIMKESVDSMDAAVNRHRIFDYMNSILIICVNFTISVLVWAFLQRILFSPAVPLEGI